MQKTIYLLRNGNGYIGNDPWNQMGLMRVFSQNSGDLAESEILFLILNYLLYTLLGNLSPIFPYFYTHFPSIFSETHILSVRLLSFGTRECYGFLQFKW